MKQLERLSNKIDRRLADLEELKELSTSIGSFDYSKDVVDTSPTGDAIERKVIKIADMEQTLREQIDFYIRKKHQIIDEIESLQEEKYVDILYKRYAEFKRLEQISCEMCISYDYAKHLHGEALLDFQNKILNKKKVDTQ